MPQTCAECGLICSDGAERCDCGYDFVSGRVRGSYLGESAEAARRPALRPAPLRVFIFVYDLGAVLGLARGVLLLAYASGPFARILGGLLVTICIVGLVVLRAFWVGRAWGQMASTLYALILCIIPVATGLRAVQTSGRGPGAILVTALIALLFAVMSMAVFWSKDTRAFVAQVERERRAKRQ